MENNNRNKGVRDKVTDNTKTTDACEKAEPRKGKINYSRLVKSVTDLTNSLFGETSSIDKP